MRISSLELIVASLGLGDGLGRTHDVGADLPPGDGVHCDHDGCSLDSEESVRRRDV